MTSSQVTVQIAGGDTIRVDAAAARRSGFVRAALDFADCPNEKVLLPAEVAGRAVTPETVAAVFDLPRAAPTTVRNAAAADPFACLALADFLDAPDALEHFAAAAADSLDSDFTPPECQETTWLRDLGLLS